MSTLITFVEPGMFTAVPAVITTRSPASTMPLARAASSERSQMSSTSSVSAISHRRHAPLERHVPQRVRLVGDSR